MAFSLVQSESIGQTINDPLSSIPITLNGVGAGNLIVLLLKYEGATTTSSVSDGTSSLTALTEKAHSNDDVRCRIFYLLSANSGNKTYTVTLGAARDWWRVHVWEFAHGGSISFDTEPSGGGGAGTGTSASSGNMTTTGTSELAIAMYGEYSASTLSSLAINGQAADGSISDDPLGTLTASWYEIFGGTFTGAATVTLSGSSAWVVVAAAFKEAAAGGGEGGHAYLNYYRNMVTGVSP